MASQQDRQRLRFLAQNNGGMEFPWFADMLKPLNQLSVQ